MREKWQTQIPLMTHIQDHPQAKELEAISAIIDVTPTICEKILQDLNQDKIQLRRSGANGMSADQVLRCAIVKVLFGFTYQELAFHIVDSRSLRWFCRIGIAQEGFQKSALNSNIKRISDATWELINRDLLGYAKDQAIEKGRQVRTDSTCVESNIHPPTDSSLLWDAVRVLTRLIIRVNDEYGKVPGFCNHCRRAKRRMLAVMNAKGDSQRKAAYIDLLKMARQVLEYARTAQTVIAAKGGSNPMAMVYMEQIQHYAKLTEQVLRQTQRRVIDNEKVPAQEKIVSIFEPHTDIIIKDRRETFYGHKICLTGGASNLILDCVIERGNPADTDLAIPMLDRQNQIYGRYPLKVCFDGGFASKANLKLAKLRKIKDVCFAKKRGLTETEMCRSEYVYHRLRRFRAGIESGISWLKRCMGLDRCTWKGWDAFKSYVWSSIVAANLLTIARAKIGAS
jgi:transposase, IS5 family